MGASDRILRIGIYGTGKWARRTHIPNFLRLEGVEIVAACDVDEGSLRETAAEFSIPRTCADGHEMLEKEDLDILFSVAPAFARTDVEATAAARGIHLFSEKPQATRMAVARKIDGAVREGEGSGILNNYRDGLFSLGPALAGWDSARNGGRLVDVPAFVES